MSSPTQPPNFIGNTNVRGPYEYILALGVIGAFGFGYGTGANDVANAFGTSVGSGALSNRSAMYIAGTCEFLGAMVLGRVSVSTISGSIAIPAAFNTAGGWYCYDTTYCSADANMDRCGKTVCNANDRTGQIFFRGGNPVAYAYGMMWVLLVGTAWLLATTYYGLNVSSTHSIIGGIIGFALSYNKDAVNWYQVKYKSAVSSCGQKAANGAVKNTACNSGAFPYSGIVPIVVTWFFAPTTTACASAMLFFVVRTLVLRSTNSYQRSFWLFPLFVFLTMFICIYFVFTKGAAATFNSDADAGWSDEKSGWVAVVIAAGCAIIAACLLPVMKKKVEQMIEVEVQQEKDFMERRAIRAGEKAPPATERLYAVNENPMVATETKVVPTDSDANEAKHDGQAPVVAADAADAAASDAEKGVVGESRRGSVKKDHFFYGGMGVQTDRNAVHLFTKEGWGYFQEDLKSVGLWTALKEANKRSLEIDRRFMHEDVLDVMGMEELHDGAEKFDPKTETAFKFLQMFSACCVMFAHGAGEVGYMAGPLSVIWTIYNQPKLTTLPSSVSAEYWILVLSAASLVIGLATYGKRVTRVIGKELAKITASRGFCAELMTAVVIMVAAQYGLPTSSSQCITGGVVGIGIMEGVKKGVNWKQMAMQFGSWIITIFVMGLGTAAFFKQGIEAPKQYA